MRPADPYVTDVLPRLFPGRGPARVAVAAGAPAPGTLQWWVLPSPQRARLLVPVAGRGAATMLRRHGGGGRGRARALVAWAVRRGVARRLPLPRVGLAPAGTAAGEGAGGLERLLEQVAGGPVSVGLLLGPPRPNRKPVLQVFGPDGGVLAFVKVGADPVTAALVRREAGCLRTVAGAGLHLVEPPAVLVATSLAGLEVLALAPLSSSQGPDRDPGAEPPLAAMAEVAGSQGVATMPLAGSPFWRDVGALASALPVGEVRERLQQVAATTRARHGADPVVMGSWHGDWAPWNMGRAGERVQVWDWERFSADVPWGMDVAHYLAQRVRHTSPGQAAQEEALLRSLPSALAGSGAHGRAQDPDLLLLCYLLTICLRFLGTGTTATGPHPRAVWALGLAERLLRERAGP